MRKIVQIAACKSLEMEAVIYALCDDGSLWRFEYGQWTQIELPSHMLQGTN